MLRARLTKMSYILTHMPGAHEFKTIVSFLILELYVIKKNLVIQIHGYLYICTKTEPCKRLVPNGTNS